MRHVEQRLGGVLVAAVARVEHAGVDPVRDPSPGAPAAGWRITSASMPIASMVCTVSRRLSPFCTELLPTEKLMTSQDRRLAAVSNEMRVRVESS